MMVARVRGVRSGCLFRSLISDRLLSQFLQIALFTLFKLVLPAHKVVDFLLLFLLVELLSEAS